MKKIPRKRADEVLVMQGLAESRSQAKLLIEAGKVLLPHARVMKASVELPIDAPLSIIQPPLYVSRGGEKIAGFFAQHPLEIEGHPMLDVGASTGGFTDFLLKNGAISVTCVDVGYGQLHAKLRDDPRVKNFEKINARELTKVQLPLKFYHGIVMDLSFISITKILPEAWAFLEGGGWLVGLIKPQFEAEKKEVDQSRGIIKDALIHERILAHIQKFALENLENSELIGVVPSPLCGADGNQEYFIGLRKQ